MAVAFDAITQGDGAGGAFDVSHTPVGTPRGIIVLVRYSTLTGDVTYGGTTMTLVNSLLDLGAGRRLAAYFLGASVPTGTQSAANSNSTSSRITVISLTADGDTEVTADGAIQTSASGDITNTFDVGALSAYIAECWASSAGAVTTTSPLTGWTSDDENDEGATTNGEYSRDALSTGVTTFGVNSSNSQTLAVLAVAVAEAAAGGVTVAVPNANAITVQAQTPTAEGGASVAPAAPTLSFGAQVPAKVFSGATVRPDAASLLLSPPVPSITAVSTVTIAATPATLQITPFAPSLGGVTVGATVNVPPISSYQPQGVNFDGTSDWLTRGADLTGAADSKLVTGSFWFLTSVANRQIHQTTNNRFVVSINTNGHISILGRNAAGTVILNFRTNVTSFANGAWHHCCFSVDMANAANRFIIMDDVAVALTVLTYTDDAMDFTDADHAIGATVAGGSKFNGSLADFWLNPGTFIDLSVEANKRLFIGASAATSVDLGSNGSIPTGSAPILFFAGDTDTWHTNDGTGGGFTENGALTDAATNPPDNGAAPVDGASLTFGLLTPDIVAASPFRFAGVSMGEGVSLPEGVTDIRTTVGQAGTNDEAEEFH